MDSSPLETENETVIVYEKELHSSCSVDKLTSEQQTFEKHSPLITLLLFSIGPLMFSAGISLHDAVDLAIISKALGESSLQIVGFSSLVRYLCLCGSIYFSQATVAKVSGLMGENRLKEAAHVVADIFRLGTVGILLIAGMFFFVSKPMLRFMGCDEEITCKGFEYLIPVLISMPFINIFQIACGFLQSEGRSILCGVMQLSAFALNCCVFAPILLFWVKVPLKYAGISLALSQSLPGLVLFFFIFTGKFGLKPTWKQLIGGFSKESFHALLLASPYFVNVLAGSLPSMLLLDMMMKAAKTAGIATEVGAVFPVYLKLNSAINSVSIGLCQGFLTAGSYCRGAMQWNRLLRLFVTIVVITSLYHLSLMPMLIFHAEIPSKIWINNDTQLEIAKKMIRIPYYTNLLIPMNYAFIIMLLVMRKAVIALALTIIRGALYVGYTCIFYYTDKGDPIRMMYAYNVDDITMFLVGGGLALHQIIYIYKEMKQVSQYESITDLKHETA